MSCGITPAALLGHSVGEYVAACAAGIFSLEDSLRLIALRGKLIFSLPPGAMLAVSLSERQAGDLLQPGLAIAAINAPSQTVVSGPIEAIANFEKVLESRGVANKRLQTSHAFHSAMLDPIVEEFVKEVSSTPRSAPKIPVLSNLSGTWLTDDEAIDPGYWGRHLRKAVRFSDCAAVVAQNQKWIVIEAGPGETCFVHPPARRLIVASTDQFHAAADKPARRLRDMVVCRWTCLARRQRCQMVRDCMLLTRHFECLSRDIRSSGSAIGLSLRALAAWLRSPKLPQSAGSLR